MWFPKLQNNFSFKPLNPGKIAETDREPISHVFFCCFTVLKTWCLSLCVLPHCYVLTWQILKLTQTSDRTTSHWRFPLTASYVPHLFFCFVSVLRETYYADWNTLSPCSGSHVKQGSDWMMPGSCYSALLKSIFPAAAGSFSLSLALWAPRSSILSASVLLLSLTRLTSRTSFFCCWRGKICMCFYVLLYFDYRGCFGKCLCVSHGCKCQTAADADSWCIMKAKNGHITASRFYLFTHTQGNTKSFTEGWVTKIKVILKCKFKLQF